MAGSEDRAPSAYSLTVPGWCEAHGVVEESYDVIVGNCPVAPDAVHRSVCRECLHVLASQYTPVWVEEGKRRWARYTVPDGSRKPALPVPSEGGLFDRYVIECSTEVAYQLKLMGWTIYPTREVNDG